MGRIYYSLRTNKHEMVTVTVRLIYEYFVFCRTYYYSTYTVNVIVNVCMIKNALNTMPHSMSIYILLDIWQ